MKVLRTISRLACSEGVPALCIAHPTPLRASGHHRTPNMAPGRSKSSRKRTTSASQNSPKHSTPNSPSPSSSPSSGPLTLGQKYFLQLVTARGYVEKSEMEELYAKAEKNYGMGSSDLHQCLGKINSFLLPTSFHLCLLHSIATSEDTEAPTTTSYYVFCNSLSDAIAKNSNKMAPEEVAFFNCLSKELELEEELEEAECIALRTSRGATEVGDDGTALTTSSTTTSEEGEGDDENFVPNSNITPSSSASKVKRKALSLDKASKFLDR